MSAAWRLAAAAWLRAADGRQDCVGYHQDRGIETSRMSFISKLHDEPVTGWGIFQHFDVPAPRRGVTPDRLSEKNPCSVRDVAQKERPLPGSPAEVKMPRARRWGDGW